MFFRVKNPHQAASLMNTPPREYTTTILGIAKNMNHAFIGAVCGLCLFSNAHGQAIVNLDLGNNALASNGAGFTKLGTASGDYAVNNGSYYLWTNVANSGLSIIMTNIAVMAAPGPWMPTGFITYPAMALLISPSAMCPRVCQSRCMPLGLERRFARAHHFLRWNRDHCHQ